MARYRRASTAVPATRGLAAVALAVLLAVAGCAGPGDRTPQPIEGTASAATVDGDARSAAGLEEVAVESGRVNRTGSIDLSGDVEMESDYRVRATAQRAVYRTPDRDPPSVFAVHSVPLVSPESIDLDIDPLGDRSTREVVGLVQGVYADVGDLEHVENESATLLGAETTLSKYATTAALEGGTVDVVVYVASVRHDGDVVRAVAVVPRAADDLGTVRRLLAAVEH